MIYLITINYNSSSYTIDFFESLKKVKTDYRLIIVDNDSNDSDYQKLKEFFLQNDYVKILEEDYPDYNFNDETRILVVRQKDNLGFAGGNNVGIKIAINQDDFDGVALINNDTYVAPDFLDEILNFKNSLWNADLIGCRILLENPDDVIWYDGGIFHKHSTRATHINENKKLEQVSKDLKPKKVSFITGCFMFISKKCIQEIGLLDDNLFMYNEDLEYCIRAQKNGLLLYQVPSSVIWHRISERAGTNSTEFSAYWGARNRFVVSKKHSTKTDQFWTIFFYIFTRVPRFTKWIINGRTGLIKSQIKGMFDGLKYK